MSNNIKNKITRTFHKTGLKIKKHSPEILVVAGIAGVITSTVMACKATPKATQIIEDAKKDIETYHELIEKPETKDKYTEDDLKNDVKIVYAQTSVKLIKTYAPAVILGTVSIASILASHNILRKRNVALAAAYATVDKSFKDYRGRVIERFGEAMDKELKYNIKAKEIEEIVIDENGNEKVEKKTVEAIDPNDISEYAVVYDDGCLGWTKDPEANKTFLKLQQSVANKKLQEQGYLFLNDVYDMLGINRIKAGFIVGWIYDEKHPIGDNFVDFGIFNIDNPATRRFINGDERNILLDFNIDGDILSLM